jgi:hypothetical protein
MVETDNSNNQSNKSKNYFNFSNQIYSLFKILNFIGLKYYLPIIPNNNANKYKYIRKIYEKNHSYKQKNLINDIDMKKIDKYIKR